MDCQWMHFMCHYQQGCEEINLRIIKNRIMMLRNIFFLVISEGNELEHKVDIGGHTDNYCIFVWGKKLKTKMFLSIINESSDGLQ